MNTREEMQRLNLAVAMLLGLPIDTVLNAQLDLATEYRQHLVDTMWLASPEEAELLGTLPTFWSWWRQAWANRDRVVLDKVPALVALEWANEGRDIAELYKAYHGPAAWGPIVPNDVVMDAFTAAQREQRAAYHLLKSLFNTL
jgi:hypothetical protein